MACPQQLTLVSSTTSAYISTQYSLRLKAGVMRQQKKSRDKERLLGSLSQLRGALSSTCTSKSGCLIRALPNPIQDYRHRRMHRDKFNFEHFRKLLSPLCTAYRPRAQKALNNSSILCGETCARSKILFCPTPNSINKILANQVS